MSRQINHFFEFGEFRLDPTERLLLRGNAPVDLTPKAFDTLLKLVENPGRLLQKGALMELVWPGTTVEENNLTQVIYMLRRALGEEKTGLQYIETVPRQGYRFVAAVHERQNEPFQTAPPDSREKVDVAATGDLAGARELRSDPPRASPSEPFRALSRPLAAGGCVLGLVVLLAALNVHGWRDRLLGSRPGSIQSLAVLPFENLSGDPAQEYFADGITEALITDLAQMGPLRVISRTSVMQYKGTRKPLKKIAAELQVDALVEGAALRSGDHIRITAQLIRTATDTHLWAGSYDGNLQDVLNFESQAARTIAREIAVKLAPGAEARLARPRPVNPEAYELYLKGRYLWNQRTPSELVRAADYFEQAIARDPDYAPAYAGLADACDLLAMDAVRPSDLLSKAKIAATRAVQLDDQLPEGHTSLAGAKVLADWDWVGAELEFQRALEIDPQYAPAHHWYATLYLVPQGRIQEAIGEMQRAIEPDPLSPIYMTDLGWTFYIARQYDQAIGQYRRTLEMAPHFQPARFRLGQVYETKGMYGEAVEETQRADNLQANSDRTTVVETYERSGHRGVMEFRLREAKLHHTHPSEGYGWAALYLGVGDKHNALDALRIGLAQHNPALIYLKVDPLFDSLRPDPAFQELERQIGLQP